MDTTIEERIERWDELTEDERLELAHELEEFEPEAATLEELEVLTPWDTCWGWGLTNTHKEKVTCLSE